MKTLLTILLASNCLAGWLWELPTPEEVERHRTIGRLLIIEPITPHPPRLPPIVDRHVYVIDGTPALLVGSEWGVVELMITRKIVTNQIHWMQAPNISVLSTSVTTNLVVELLRTNVMVIRGEP